jgi:hypothetical protein
MDKKLICVVAILAVFAGIGLLMMGGNQDTNTTDGGSSIFNQPSIFYDSEGKVSPSSSDLALYYNNDMSIYGYYVNDVFQGMAYYDDADIKGVVTMDLSKVKWDKDYDPSSYSDSTYEHVNDVKHAKKNFADTVQKDYKDGKLDLTVTMDFYKSNGKHVKSLYELNDYGDKMKVSLKKGILKVKVKHKFNTNSTKISNDVPYDGALSQKQSDFSKTSKAIITATFKGDDYEYVVTSTLKGDNFYLIHT